MDVVSSSVPIPQIHSPIDIEPDEESSESDTIITPSVKPSSNSFQKFMDGFLWDAEKIKTPKEAKKLGKSLVDQVYKLRKPNMKQVRTVKLERNCVFYNGKWLRKLRTIKKVKRRRKIKPSKAFQTAKSSENHASKIGVRCESDKKIKNVIFEAIYSPFIY